MYIYLAKCKYTDYYASSADAECIYVYTNYSVHALLCSCKPLTFHHILYHAYRNKLRRVICQKLP